MLSGKEFEEVDLKTIGDRIKEARTLLGLSMDKFAAPLGISRVSISKIESGENNPSKQTILAICREFSINEEWLRSGQGDMKAVLSREEAIADIMNKILAEEPKLFRMTLINHVIHMSSEQLEFLEKMVRELYEEQETKNN